LENANVNPGEEKAYCSAGENPIDSIQMEANTKSSEQRTPDKAIAEALTRIHARYGSDLTKFFAHIRDAKDQTRVAKESIRAASSSNRKSTSKGNG
jgi:hypothetical protein